MTEKRFTVVSKYDGVKLSGVLYEPDGEPKGIVQLVHGMCEHKERYLPFLRFLAEQGYIAECHDHRGHGESVEQQADFGWFGDYEGKAVVEDTAQITRYLKTEYPNLTVTLFGHSMGALIVRCFLREYDSEIDKLIVCGSPSKNPLVGIAIGLEKCIRFFRGKRHRSKLLYYLSTGKGDKKFPGEGKNSWLTRDKEIVQTYGSDPKSGYIFTCNGYENLFKLMKRTYQKKGYGVENPALPIHFVAGGDDPVIENELKWFQAIEFLRDVGYTQVSGKLYEGMRHEILNEVGKEEVYADLLAFIEK